MDETQPIVYRYNPDMNPDGAVLDGVPLRDLTAEDVDALPAHLQRSVADCLFYEPVAQDAASVISEPAEEPAAPAPAPARRRAPIV